MKFNFKQISTVANYEMMDKFQSVSYWTIVIIPFILSVYLIRARYIVSINTNVIGILLSLFTLMFCLIYIIISANSVAKDKTTKISEMILSIVGAKEQMFGKFLGVFILSIIHILIYTITIYLYILCTNNIILKNVHNLNLHLIIYMILANLCTIFVSIIATMILASYITDSTQTMVATMPLSAFVGEMTIAGILLSGTYNNLTDNFVESLIFGLCLCIPVFGSVVSPILLLTQNISYLEAYFTLIIQLVIIIIFFKKSIYQYKFGLLTSKKVNILGLLFKKSR